MSDTVFRTPVSQTEEVVAPAQNPDRVHEGAKEVPIGLYRELRGMPYSAEYFDVAEIWNSDKLDLKQDLEEIDDYYRGKLNNETIKDSKDSFDQVMKEAIQATGCETDSENIKIVKLAEWARFQNKIRMINKLKT